MQAPHGLVCIAEFKIGLEDKAQPEALRYHEQLWEETWPGVLNESFAATFVIEMMGAGLRCWWIVDFWCIHVSVSVIALIMECIAV